MFADEGARVVVTGRNVARGTAVVDRIVQAGGAARFLAADLTDETACAGLVEEAAQWLGGLTVLGDNAAAATGGENPPPPPPHARRGPGVRGEPPPPPPRLPGAGSHTRPPPPPPRPQTPPLPRR